MFQTRSFASNRLSFISFSSVIVIGSSKEDKPKGKNENEEKTPFWVYCTWVAIIFVVVMVLAVIFLFSKHKHARGGVGSGMSLGGGGMGGGGMCFDASMTVWAKNETQPDQDAVMIMAKDVEEGDLVKTIDLANPDQNLNEFIWTRATDVDIFWGNWEAYHFVFASGHDIKVTSPHVMIVSNNGVLYLKRADQVQIGDQMKVGNEMTRVTEVFKYRMKTKVSIETEDGTIQVNDVLATGVCDDNHEITFRISKAQEMLQDYKRSHFGEHIDNQCMDTIDWMNAYLKNNGNNDYLQLLGRMEASDIL